jgi:hypothetical protein
MPQRSDILASWMLCGGFTVCECTDACVNVVYTTSI